MKCCVCFCNIRWNQPKLECSCGRQCHESCSDTNVNTHSNRWICSYCILIELPFNHILDDQEFLSTLYAFFHYTKNTNSSELDSYVFDAFQMNSTYVSSTDIDKPCNYYFNDDFNEKLCHTNCNDSFSIFHLNSRSLASNYLTISD